ncbi:UbiH/UbiF/VisC/COQ6 family ubiquinone biosynthesis hydroxylase [Halorhodospira halophila]|uniref:Ubiquinone biosynthesis hydroxylase, UbiH/UbiF/VisC/COQ6 family n=1 Tax=Halorhodospira halophila (strain DSM 244 / SL1) TaxID=349124 RepID=A1WZ77_HALHL|nr:UbiH/UbiF/VisC/COQ6 family ubiquinone biosynthesis hydroxylase [Halorhodospira halophila]ABM62989.1 Ubiquinone biosynthesis hydroxylase, UbiH/UbiF/VisC/COQ6 family [Halorhodospira halophila SL1]
MNSPPRCHDVVVVGGGMVGAAVAADFAGRGWRVGVVETTGPKPVEAGSPYHLRVSALNLGSEGYLDELGAWHAIRGTRACPYRRLQVWDGDHAGRLTFHAEDLGPGTNHLGHIVENDLIQEALWSVLGRSATVHRYCPNETSRLEPAPFGATVRLDDGRRIHGNLVIAADGAQSRLRQSLGIPVTVRDYRQHAVVAEVATRLGQQDITWQRFLPEGPQAFLPLVGARASLVWYTTPDRARQLVELPNEQLGENIEAAFPPELGGIEAVVQRASFPIRAQHAHSYLAPGVVLIGDAAHTIHPLAGQGVNLGLRDARALARHVAAAVEAGYPPDDPRVLSAYARERRQDNQLAQSTMTGIHELFGSRCTRLARLRPWGLRLADHGGPAKRLALRYASYGSWLG